MKRALIVGAVAAATLCLGIAAHAVTGQRPFDGFGSIDGTWLRGLSGGLNWYPQSAITAHAGGTQAAAFQLPSGVYLIEVDTVATNGDSVMLPQCLRGTQFYLANAGASTLNVYGNVAVNPVTGSADTINATAGSTAYTMATNTNAYFFCAKDGAWKAVKGS